MTDLSKERERGETIIAAAIRQYGLTVSLPPPARHHNLLHPMHKATGVLVALDDQGFLTSTGRFVDRIEAVEIATAAGQIEKPKWPPYLYSEDLW